MILDSGRTGSTKVEDLIEDLSHRIGGNSRQVLERLPIQEVRYLALREDLVREYADHYRRDFVLEYQMDAVARGNRVINEIGDCCSVDWKGARALDVGCGDGGFVVAMALRGAEAYGLELNASSVVGAALRAKEWSVTARILQGTAEDLPFNATTFDVVTCGDVIEHVPRPARVLSEIARLLRPGGVLWLNVPTRYHLPYIWREPHYDYFGIGLLPRSVAAWYMTYIRKVIPSVASYYVQRLPSRWQTLCFVRRCGFEILSGLGPTEKLNTPERIGNNRTRVWVQQALRFGLRAPLTLTVAVMEELRQPVRLICRKI
jgi:2-polyprenyl-3-methyl-5-hydroxy-6-metoxy-1,4-benzoquinol methylase